MAQHDVSFTVPERALGKADLEFRVKRGGKVLGRLKVSNGTIVWVPKDSSYGYKMGWSDFDVYMREHGKHDKK